MATRIIYYYPWMFLSVIAQNVKLRQSSQPLNLGGNAQFECIHEGTDIPYLSINGQLYNIINLPDGKYEYAGGILTVKHVDESDNGTQIQCVFSTAASNNLTLNVSTTGTIITRIAKLYANN